MPRNFSGSTDKVTVTPGVVAVATAFTRSGRNSHPVPFVLSGGNVLLGYCSNEDGGGNFLIKRRISTDNGATWGTVATLAGTNANGSNSYECAFAQLAGGNVVCVYGYDNDVRQKISTDGGSTWGSETTITASTGVDPHPSLILDGTTLVVCYGTSSVIAIKTSTDGGTTWSGATTVVSSGTPKDANIRKMPNGDYLVSYMTAANAILTVRSTNAGSSWAAAVSTGTTDAGSNEADPNLLVDSSTVWLTWSNGATFGGSPPGSRILYGIVSNDSGVTWSNPSVMSILSANDMHRVNGCLVSGSPLFWAAYYDLTEYNISKITPTAGMVTEGRLGYAIQPIQDLQVFTAMAWVKYNGTPNGSNAMYIASKSGVNRVYLYLEDGGVYTKNLVCFVNRATTATNYISNNNAIAASTWTFVAVTFDDTRGTGNRAKFYAGTTPSNLAQVTTDTGGSTEGSGVINSDRTGDFVVAGRSTDNARNFGGDIGQIQLIPSVLTLSEMQAAMNTGSFPTATAGVAWLLPTATSGTAADSSGYGNTGTISGTTASSTEIPTFVGVFPHFLRRQMSGGMIQMSGGL